MSRLFATGRRARVALGIATVTAAATAGVAAPVTGHASSGTPSCTLTAMVLGGNPVISASATNLKHSASFVIAWTEPAITQTQYVSSTSWGTAGQTVLNNQGSGTFTAAFWSADRAGQPLALQATCSITV